jgi:hypothetical protein
LPRTFLAGSTPARGDELHVHATSERKISTEDQPPAATAEASAGTDELHVRSADRSKLPSSGSVAGAPANGEELNVHATPKTSTDETTPEHPTAAVPTFKEWHQLYPANRLDAQKADQIFKALDDFDKIKATDGLRAHLVCERWRRTPDYIPLASKFLSERYYDYAPAPYFELKKGNSVPTQNRSHDPAPPFTAENWGIFCCPTRAHMPWETSGKLPKHSKA